MLTFKELRDKLEPQDIKDILKKYNIEPHYENKNYIIYETCCHNPVGEGSHKLYYYTNTHMFKCYTKCDCMFDIFDLIIKIEQFQGRRIGKAQAINIAGFELNSAQMNEIAADSIVSDFSRLVYLNGTGNSSEEKTLTPLKSGFLDERFCFDIDALQIWMDEGITLNSMFYYRITYDPIDNCIIIPQYDEKGNIVGVRGRYVGENVKDKYRPIMYNGVLLNAPTNMLLYGYWQNKRAIEMTKTCIIFEAEKSVLRMDGIYDKNNISVATYGQTISKKHIQLLLDAGVTSVVLAFDADYRDDKEAAEVLKEYKKIAKPLTTYFTVSIIMDLKGRLNYKDSPIDKGEKVFNELMKERIYI